MGSNFLPSGYSVVKKFKETGQKKVYLSKNTQDNLEVVKIGKSPSSNSLKRAKREIEVQQQIDSKYFPKVLKFEVFKGTNFRIIEEYIESDPLSVSFDRFNSSVEIIDLLDHLVTAMKPLWEKEIIHRDLKPDNILIKPKGKPAIIDLGIVLAKDMTQITFPFAKMSPCTPTYAAPELLKYRRYEVNHRTDQFILGINLLQIMMDGQHPFDPSIVGGNSIPENILNRNFDNSILSAEEFSKLRPIINRILSKEPYGRFRTPGMLKEEIHLIKEKLQ